MDHRHRTQFLRTVSMRQPTMYSYMASHRYLYQIVFNTLCSHTVGHVYNFIIHPRWIRPDTTLSNSGHNKQAWMSRHIRAQTTPTHASGFHLFTMAMTSHVEERGSTTATCNSWIGVVLMSEREYEQESGIVSEWTRGFCLPGTSEDSIVLHWCHWSHRWNASIERGQLPATEKETQSMQCTIWCMLWHGNKNVFWANATSSRLNWVGLNPRFKFKLHMWLLKCHSFHLS